VMERLKKAHTARLGRKHAGLQTVRRQRTKTQTARRSQVVIVYQRLGLL